MLKQESTDQIHNGVEVYIMVPNEFEPEITEKYLTIFVKRMNMTFNEKDC